MRKIGLFFMAACLILSSCSYSQFAATTSGSSLGGMFGSSIGGLMGGYRGHNIGTVAGMTAGAAIGLAATSKRDKPEARQTEPEYVDDYEDYEDYDSYEEYTPKSSKQQRSVSTVNELNALEIERIHFTDANKNQRLEPEEQASLVMAIYNRGDYTLYNIAPQITCDNKRIRISPTAIVSELAPGQGFRYRAKVIASSKLKSGETIFKVSFANGKDAITKKSFRILTSE